MSAGRFRKRPVVVDAIQWTGENTAECVGFVDSDLTVVDGKKVDADGAEVADGLDDHRDGTADLWVEANNAWVPVAPGEWIIRDASGCYPCLPVRFAETYEPDA